MGISSGKVTYGAVAETNRLTVTRGTSNYTVADTGVALLADGDGPGGCSVTGGKAATCPLTGVNGVFVSVGTGKTR